MKVFLKGTFCQTTVRFRCTLDRIRRWCGSDVGLTMRVGMGMISERGCPHLTGAELEGLCDGLQEFAVSQ